MVEGGRERFREGVLEKGRVEWEKEKTGGKKGGQRLEGGRKGEVETAESGEREIMK